MWGALLFFGCQSCSLKRHPSQQTCKKSNGVVYEPLTDTESRVERRDRRRCTAGRRGRGAFDRLRSPLRNGARSVVEEVEDLGKLGSDVALAVGHDEALNRRNAVNSCWSQRGKCRAHLERVPRQAKGVQGLRITSSDMSMILLTVYDEQ